MIDPETERNLVWSINSAADLLHKIDGRLKEMNDGLRIVVVLLAVLAVIMFLVWHKLP